MVKLDKIYTRSGDKGKTRLSTGEPVDKWHPRVVAYGTVDETNAALGVAALKAEGDMLAAVSRMTSLISAPTLPRQSGASRWNGLRCASLKVRCNGLKPKSTR